MSAAGQFFLKLGALKLGRVSSDNLVGHLRAILTTPELLAGLSCYALGALAYILLLTRIKLSVAGPAASLIYLFSVGLGYFFFHESIPLSRFLGLSLILMGVALVVWKS